MYTRKNFKSKAALKRAIANGEKITVYQPGPFASPGPIKKTVYLEGPHYPEPHRWYAKGTMDETGTYLIKVT